MRNNILILILFIASGLYYNKLSGQTIVKQDGKYGLTDEKGNVLLKTEYDKIEQFDESTPSCFIVKKNRKFGYAYKVELDSTVWLNERNRYWTFSKLEFDTIYGFIIGGARYSTSFGYTTMAYKKNNHWGMICIQTHAGSGDGIFPSMGFYVGGMGKATVHEAKYDTIIQRESADDFYTTRLNGKYGFWEPTTNEVYEPEFDSIPFTTETQLGSNYAPRHRFIKKNGKWGYIYLNPETKKIQYKVPCMCNGLGGGGDSKIYFCMGQNDTLQFYNAITQERYVPLIDGKPLKTLFYWKPLDNRKFSFQEYIGSYETILGSDSMFYSLRGLGKNSDLIAIKRKTGNEEKFPIIDSYTHSNTTISVYFVDIKSKINLFAFTDTMFYYDIISPLEPYSQYAPLLIKAQYNKDKNIYIREFYDALTGEFTFRLQSTEKYLTYDQIKKETKNGMTTWYQFTSYSSGKSDEGKIMGYYNLTTKKFSKRRK